MTAETWRVVLADGSVREVVVTQHESGQWLARVPGVWGEEHGVTPASAVTRLVLSVGWALREILAPGEPTRAEAVAAACERCAKACDGLADEAQREVVSQTRRSGRCVMYLSELESVLRIAVTAYQVEHGEGSYLVDPDNVTFEILPPGTWDSTAEKRVERWTFVMGEEGDRGIARAEGDTLAAALDAFAALVRERANVVHALLDGDDPMKPDGADRWHRVSDDTAFGLMHDRIHEDHGPVRGARSVKVPREDGAP